jgi:hypothetical protein
MQPAHAFQRQPQQARQFIARMPPKLPVQTHRIGPTWQNIAPIHRGCRPQMPDIPEPKLTQTAFEPDAECFEVFHVLSATEKPLQPDADTPEHEFPGRISAAVAIAHGFRIRPKPLAQPNRPLG